PPAPEAVRVDVHELPPPRPLLELRERLVERWACVRLLHEPRDLLVGVSREEAAHVEGGQLEQASPRRLVGLAPGGGRQRTARPQDDVRDRVDGQEEKERVQQEHRGGAIVAGATGGHAWARSWRSPLRRGSEKSRRRRAQPPGGAGPLARGCGDQRKRSR